MNQPHPAAVVVLAAGEGKRMRSRTPKVLHRIAGRTLLEHVLAAVGPLGADRQIVVVGHGRDEVITALAGGGEGSAPDVHPPVVRPEAVVQDSPNGTGHAVRTALDSTEPFKYDDVIVVVPGDAPLLTTATLSVLLDTHRSTAAAATLLTAVLDDPRGYGRIVRDAGGAVAAIVEQRDADTATQAIHEVATSVYAFNAGPLRDALAQVSRDNAQGEEYLTDVVAILVGDGLAVSAHVAGVPTETVGVNDRAQLSAAGLILRDRIVERVMREGTTVVDPASTWIDTTVTFEPDSTVLPQTVLEGRTHVARDAVVGPECTLIDTVVLEGARVTRTTAQDTEIGPGATIGPYTHLRPGTRLGRGVKVGAFAETKSATIGDGAKVPHLAYVGDAVVGARSNIGCGTVFANYDGVSKHRTVIGEDVKIGSNNVLVAPVTIGDGAYTGGGAVIKDDVPPGALAVNDGRQRIMEGWVERRRPGSAAAGSAARARRVAIMPDDQARHDVADIGDNGDGTG